MNSLGLTLRPSSRLVRVARTVRRVAMLDGRVLGCRRHATDAHRISRRRCTWRRPREPLSAWPVPVTAPTRDRQLSLVAQPCTHHGSNESRPANSYAFDSSHLPPPTHTTPVAVLRYTRPPLTPTEMRPHGLSRGPVGGWGPSGPVGSGGQSKRITSGSPHPCRRLR